MSFKKTILKKVHGFDSNYPPPLSAFEELDLGIRIKKFGSIKFCPQAIAYHHKNKTGGTRTDIPTKQQLYYYSLGYYFAKNIIFPFSLISLAIRSRTALLVSKKSLISLYKGYACKILKPINILIALIIFAAIFLRFWKLPDRFIFDIDTEYQALLAKTIINDFHIIWIGVSASNTGYYLGPGLVYLSAFLLWFSKGDPVIFGYFASLIGVLTVLSIYFVVSRLYNQKIAIMSTVMYGFSSFVVFYDRKYWPIFIPLIAIWIFFSLVKSRNNPRWLILASVLIALSYHIHLSLWIFWPFIIWSFIRVFRKIDIFTWILSITGYVIITFPLMVFDYVHNFDNLLMPIRFIRNLSKNQPMGTDLHFAYFWTLVDKVLYIYHQNNQIVSIVISIFFILVVLSLIKIKKTPSTNLLAGVVFAFILLFGFYPGPIQEYYMVLFFPFFALAISIFLNRLSLIIVVPFIIIFSAVNSYNALTQNNAAGLTVKKNFIKSVSQKLNDDYYLSFDNKLDFEGWRYLFEVYGKKPAQSQADQMFGWIYPQDISADKPRLKLIVSYNNDLMSETKVKNKVSIDGIFGYIVDN